MQHAFRADELRKRYDGKDALSGVSLDVAEGEVVGLLGPNGAGKSTLAKIACGLVRPSGGSAEVAGHPAGSRPARAAIGYLAELFRFPAWLTADELLTLHQRLAGSSGGAAERAELLELVGLADAARTAGRLDVEGNAAAPGDRPGAGREPRASAARRADQRARPGRAAGRATSSSTRSAGAAFPSCSRPTC